MPKIDSAYPQPLCKHIALLQTSLVEMKPIAWFGLGGFRWPKMPKMYSTYPKTSIILLD